MKELRDHGAEGAAGHDDRALGAKRPAGTDRNCRREWFEKRDFRLDAAAIDENCFDRFRNAVAADALRAIARHHANDERAANRNKNAVETEMVAGGGNHRSAPVAKIKEVREQAD